MNFDDVEEFSLTEDVRDIERRFCEFYLEIITDYFDLDDEFIWTEKEIRNRRRKKRNDSMINEPKKALLFGIQDTCLALRKFYASLMEYVEVAKYLSKKNPLKMHCFIGDSFFAALGICIVIDEAIKQYCQSDKNGVKIIQLSITDKRQNWVTLCVFIINTTTHFFKNIKIELEFFDESAYRVSENLISTISETDILVMTRFLSTFQFLRTLTPLLQVVLKNMKEFSILFYLDKMYYQNLKKMIFGTESLMEIKSRKTVYESLEEWRNREYYLKFPFLFTTQFDYVIFSTCVKCPGLRVYSSDKKNTNENSASLKEFRKKMKRIISEKFENETSVLSCASKLDDLTVSSNCSTNISIKKNAHETASRAKKVFMVSKCSSKIPAEKIPPINVAEEENLTITSKCSSKISTRKIPPVNASDASKCFSKMTSAKIPPVNASEAKNLITSSKCSPDIAIEGDVPVASGFEKVTKSLKKCDNKNNSPSTSKISTSCKKKKTKLPEQFCKVGKVMRPLPVSSIFKEKELTAEMFKKEKLIAKLSP